MQYKEATELIYPIKQRISEVKFLLDTTKIMGSSFVKPYDSLMLHRKIFLWDTFIRHYSYWHELQQPLSHCIKRLRFHLQRKALIYKL